MVPVEVFVEAVACKIRFLCSNLQQSTQTLVLDSCTGIGSAACRATSAETESKKPLGVQILS